VAHHLFFHAPRDHGEDGILARGSNQPRRGEELLIDRGEDGIVGISPFDAACPARRLMNSKA